VMSGFLIKGAGGIVWFLLISPWFGEGGVLGVLPGLTVLLSPIIGRSIFELRATWTLEWTHAMALAAQAAVGAICFIGAMRKYRAEQTPLFGPALGLALLAAWVAVSFAGIRQWEEFRPRFLRIHMNQGVQILSSILAAMLFALMPISAAAREHVQRRWRAMMHDPAPLRRAMPWWVLVFVATALIIAICIAPESQSAWSLDSVARTGIVIALALAGVYFLCRACYQFIGAASFIIGGWIFLTWVLPLLLDVGRYALSTDPDAPPITRISSFGAAGALGLIWTGSGDKTTSGIMVQALIACAAVLFSIVAEKRSGQVR